MEQLLIQAHELAGETGDRNLMLRATTGLASALLLQFRVDEGDAMIQPALLEFADMDEGLLAELRSQAARVQYLNRDFRGALETTETVLTTAEQRGLIWLLTHSLIGRANALYSLGRRREAIGEANLALELSTEHGFNDVRLRAMGNLANVQTEADVRKSFDSLAEGIVLARKLGMRAMLINTVGNLGYSGFLAGEWDAALTEMDTFLAEDIAHKDRLVVLNNATIIRAARGEPADEALAEMARIGSAMSGKWHVFVADPEANAAMAKGEWRKARDGFMEIAQDDAGVSLEYFYRAAVPSLIARDAPDAKDLLRRLEETSGFGPVFESRLQTLRAGIAALEDRPKEAMALYREALRGWHATNSVWDEALTGVTMAQLLDPALPEVAEAIASTRAILGRLRARPYLQMLEAAASRNDVEPPVTGKARQPIASEAVEQAEEVAVTE
jgi:tetratricopeptide (TPR) repeat protein